LTRSENPASNGPNVDATLPSGNEGSAARRLALNAGSNWAAMGLDMLVRLIMLRYLYSRLGREDYGIYLLAVSITQMTYLLRFGLVGTVLRIAGEDIGTRDWKSLNTTLSVVRTLLMIGGVLAFGIALFFSLFMLDVLKVPAASQSAAAILIQLAGVSAACHVASGVYMGALWAAQRNYVTNIIAASVSLLWMGLVTLTFELGWTSLEMLGACMAAPSVLGILTDALMVRLLMPHVRMKFGYFTRAAFKRVLALGSWMGVSLVMFVIHDQIGAQILSALAGVGAVPLLAVPRQIVGQLTRVVGGLTLPVRPLATEYAVQGQQEKLQRLYRTLVRFTSLLLVPMVILFITYGKTVIGILTDRDMADESFGVLIAYVLLFGVNLLGQPGVNILMGVAPLRSLALVQSATLVLGVIVALAASPWLGGSVIALVIFLYTPTLFYSLGYVTYRIHRDTGVSISITFLTCLLPPILGGIVPLALGLGLQYVWPIPETASRLVQIVLVGVQMLLCGGAYLAAAWPLILNKDERRIVWSLFPLKRKSPVEVES